MYQTAATTKELFSLSENKPLPVEQVRTQHSLRFFKVALDYIIVIPGILFLLPLFALLALAVRLDSPGPIIHRRRVLGKDGRVFHAYKFRTMYVNGDEILDRYPELKAELAQNHKLKNDPRITRIGAILRKFSLDELPQLFNIVKQDMSLVGPRIIAPNEITKYGEWGETLLTVMPGLTGLWQVSGRSNTTYDDRVQLDMTYIHNYSLWLDIKIILKTVPAVLKGEGAY
ncbi:MAG: hypothetical protein Kow0080_34870 [Candidatus Promineifilaceae bacterium]